MIKQKVGTEGEGLESVNKTSKIRMEKLFEQVKKCASNYPNIYKIVLFGSRARGNYRPNSDIDLAIFSSSRSNLEVANFTDEIADEICDRIIKSYFQEFKALSKRLAE
ncbi:polymerase beta, Nucleotidyltransferase [anaerobic digester metagenome]